MLGFCGVNVPVSFWPAWLQAAVQFLPLTHGLADIRALLNGASATSITADAARELAVMAGWLLIAAVTMDRMANAGRANGSIELMR